MKLLTKSNSTAVQFMRYVFVGGGATVIQWGMLALFKEIVGLNANLANMIGFIGGLTFNYIISTSWVFDSSSVKSKASEVTAFTIIGVVGLGINQGIIYLFDKILSEKEILGGIIPTNKYYLVGQVIATGLAFFWNFFARKFLIYNNTEDRQK